MKTINSSYERVLESTMKLGRLLGTVSEIHVREEHHTDNIDVTVYHKCLNPWNEIILLTPDQIRKYESLGLSIRRVL